MRGFCCTIIFSLLAGCNYSILKNPAAAGGGTQGDLKATATIDYALMQTSVLSTCTNCHSGRQSPSLVGQGAVQQNINAVFGKVSAGLMPPADQGYARLSACQVAALKKWMDLGTPATSTVLVSTLPECQQATVAPPVAVPVPLLNQPLTYQTLLTQILQPRCLKCHNVNDLSDASAFLFFPYPEIQTDTRDWTAPGAASRVVRMLTRTDEHRMPPPDDSEPLSAEQIQFVIQYLDAGKLP